MLIHTLNVTKRKSVTITYLKDHLQVGPKDLVERVDV